MEITFLQVADYANTTADQKLNVMGIFSNISALTFPIVHPEMYLVAQLNARAPEYGRKFKFGVKLINEDGAEILNFSGDAAVPVGDRGLPVHMNLTFRLVNTQFPAAGTYEFSLLIDGDVKGALPVELLQVTPPQPGPDQSQK